MANCPICGYPQYCGCTSCARSPAPYGFKRQEIAFVKDTLALYICPNCRRAFTADEWTTLDLEQYAFTLKILGALRPDIFSPEFLSRVWERIAVEKKLGDF